MRRLIAGIILITLNCVVILAQQKDKLPTQPTPIAVGLLTSDPPLDVASLPFGQFQINDRKISPSSESENPEGPFVFQDGALYMRMPRSQFLMPVSGGGASGCFSLDLPRRITNLKEFIPKLDPPRTNQAGATLGSANLLLSRKVFSRL